MYSMLSVPRQSSSINIYRRITLNALLCMLLALLTFRPADGQITIYELDGTDAPRRYVSALFLTIAPDARSTGMGNVGVASEQDINSQYWNSAKYTFVEGKGGISFTYTSWLTNLVPGIYKLYLSGYSKIGNKNTVSGSFQYFSHGTLDYRHFGTTPVNPYEFALDAGYSRRFTDHFSGGIVLRYIHSHPTNGWHNLDGSKSRSGKSVSGDLGLYYQNDLKLGGMDAIWALGMNISNVGTPISYELTGEHKTPIPTNLRIGGRFSVDFNEHNSLSLHAEANKLLVPTVPFMAEDTVTGDLYVVRGKEAPESVLAGMVQSFYDAPGFMQSDRTYSVLQEELSEVAFSIGAEYWFDKAFAIRFGYHHEHQAKGNRRFFTFGIGGKYRFLAADISYLIPVNGQNSPLAKTFRFSLAVEFGKVSPKLGKGPAPHP